MTQIPILKGDDEKMLKKHGTITLILIQLFVIYAMVGALSPTIAATNNDANTTTSNPDFPKLEFVPGEVLVKFKTGVSLGLTSGIVTTSIASVDKLNKRFEASGIEKVFSNVYKLTLPMDSNIFSAAKEYETNPNVEYAEPNGKVRALLVPNDANYPQQWAHQMIESEYAWNTTTGDSSVLVAVADTGINYSHPDLDANYVSLGYDWVNDDSDPMDDHGHGTHCAGIIAAEINNNIGVAGLAQVQIMAEKVLDGEGYGYAEDIASGILHAADQGADIISMSFGGDYPSAVLSDAVKNASDRGVLLVAAAGNIRWSKKLYPAAYEEVIAVAATDHNDNPADWPDWGGFDGGSAFGDWIELAAPGDEICSTWRMNTYANKSGTSMAAPHISGVAALVLSQFPDFTHFQVWQHLRETAVDKGDPGFDIYYGYGRINASGAVNQEPPEHDLIIWDLKLPFVSEPSDTVAVNTTVFNYGTKNEGNVDVKLLANGTEVDSKRISALNSGEAVLVSLSWTPTNESKYNITTYVEPAKKETIIDNNSESAYMWVKYGKTVIVPMDFATIKKAVDATNEQLYYGDATIWVASGTYYEADLLIQNSLTSLTLIGENRSSTIVDGSPIPGRKRGFLVNANNVTITGFYVRKQAKGVELWGVNGNISGNTFEENDVGVKGAWTAFNIISNNEIYGYSYFYEYGIYLLFSSNNTISNNTIFEKKCGVFVDLSNYNTISNNNITNIKFGYHVHGPGDAIFLRDSNYTSISGNTLSNNEYAGIAIWRATMHANAYNNFISGNTITNNEEVGIYLVDVGSNNTIVENIVKENGVGIKLLDGNTTIIHHNNFINNTLQAYTYISYNNAWNFTTWVGNYWSDYNSTDLYSGPYQNETGSDGIWDTSYVIDENNEDSYPLVWKWFPGDLDGDGDVDDDDYDIFSDAYGSEMGDPNYNPLADLDYDGDVDRYDYGIFAQNYGKTIPY